MFNLIGSEFGPLVGVRILNRGSVYRLYRTVKFDLDAYFFLKRNDLLDKVCSQVLFGVITKYRYGNVIVLKPIISYKKNIFLNHNINLLIYASESGAISKYYHAMEPTEQRLKAEIAKFLLT